ncbi:hypothetical protein K474DRAFT_1306410 [Panus rudis PR-1116 ss-1]|nr:hypothetical protein K474DRAFT_1306410 [Panus rudis PR-1116 ss-1]
MSSSVSYSSISLVALNFTSVTSSAVAQSPPAPLSQSEIAVTSISIGTGVSGAISGVTSAIESPSSALVPSSTPLATATTVPCQLGCPSLPVRL